MFKKVSREQNRLRLALDGPAGSGKTYTALRFAFALAGPAGRVAVIDTEHGSAAKYEGEKPDGIPWIWDGVMLEHFAPSTYEQAIKAAGSQGYDVLVIDSLSHAWTGIGGALEQVDRGAAKAGNSFTAWRDVTPQHNAMVEAILASPCHVIATMRSRMEYVLEADERGKMVPRKVGMKPVQREGVEYEFDVICDLDDSHKLTVSKSRCSAVDRKIVVLPDAGFMGPVKEWLTSGAARVVPAPAVPPGGSFAPAAAAGVNLNGKKCPEHLAAQIRQVAKDLGWGPEKLRDVVRLAGVERLADLNEEQAAGLVKRLASKQLKAEGEIAF